MALEKKSTTDDADKSSEKVSKKSSDKNSAKSAEKDKGSKKDSAASEKTKKKSTADKGSKKSSSSKKKHPERSGNPAKAAKAAKALEEESRAAANRVSRTPKKIKDTASPRWYAPTMVTLLVIGLLWVVATYLFGGRYPLPYFAEHHIGDWLYNGNLYIGFLIMLSGFLGLLRWK